MAKEKLEKAKTKSKSKIRYVPLTVLHSNDLHGDFHAEQMDEKVLGGISMLSGYVTKVRAEAPNMLYCIAGDMLQGSVIDSEFKGMSTIEIMNLLNPDVATIGNHEIDYGLAHLLFLERCAKFPIVNANLFIKNPYTRLFKSHQIIEVGDMKIMFIGVTTKEILMGMKSDSLGSFINVEDAAKEVGNICNSYRNIHIDFTILLTHIGFENDKLLASLLDPVWSVDLIIGGHTHTILEQPVKVNNALIAQAGVGTRQIGRFDIIVDTKYHIAHSFKWELIPIDSAHCPRDIAMEETILRFQTEMDNKYNRVLCRFRRELTHPDRYQETELGNLFADILQEDTGVDILMLGSGSIRKTSVSTVLTMGELMELFPYDDKLWQLTVTGSQLRRMLHHVFRDEMGDDAHTEFYQYSVGMRVEYDRAKKEFTVLALHGEPIDGERLYTIGLQEYHHVNFNDCFGFAKEEVLENTKARVLSTSVRGQIVEFFSSERLVEAKVEGRIVF